MNIFYLHPQPSICAAMHCDKHVVKMILEYSQLLSTAHHLSEVPQECTSMFYIKELKELHKSRDEFLENILKPTHANHPCAIWARASSANYLWLYELLDSLHGEYYRRYGKVHALRYMQLNYLQNAPVALPGNGPAAISAPPLAMPSAVKVLGSHLIQKFCILTSKAGGKYTSKMLVDVSPDALYPEAAYLYRIYYKSHKAHILSYTGTKPPRWCEDIAKYKLPKPSSI